MKSRKKLYVVSCKFGLKLEWIGPEPFNSGQLAHTVNCYWAVPCLTVLSSGPFLRAKVNCPELSLLYTRLHNTLSSIHNYYTRIIHGDWQLIQYMQWTTSDLYLFIYLFN